jgi:hypothetical protein
MACYTNDRTDTITDTLSSLNDTVTLAVANYASVGCTILAGTLAATVLIEESFDNGTNWVVCTYIDPTTGVASAGNAFTNPNPVTARTVVVDGGATHIRLRVSAYTSGSADAVISATAVYPKNLLSYALNTTGGVTPIRCDASGNLITNCATLSVTNTGTTGNAVTLTLPNVSAQSHYITFIEIEKYFTAANAASGTPLLVTTTNLPGSLVFTFGQPLGVVGVCESRIMPIPNPLKSSVANTNTTIVGPATTGIIWRITAHYFTAP